MYNSSADAGRATVVDTAVPLVTAIVAVHNEERHLAKCLRSLAAQTYPSLEILVVDDGSTDGTREVANREGVRLLAKPHRGKAAAVNDAAAAARGDVLLFLDGDMVFDARYVELLVGPILTGALGTAHAEEFVANPDNRWARCLQEISGLPKDRRWELSEHNLQEGNIVYRAIAKNAFLAVGGFEHRGYVDDRTLYPKLGRRAQFVREARAWHYNPETLKEVWQFGRWSGKHVTQQLGRKALILYALPSALVRGLKHAFNNRDPWLVVYCAVRDTAVFVSVLLMILRIERHMGK